MKDLEAGRWYIDSGEFVDFLEDKYPSPKLGKTDSIPDVYVIQTILVVLLILWHQISRVQHWVMHLEIRLDLQGIKDIPNFREILEIDWRRGEATKKQTG